jgi:small-conductance mechanosensitive channel
MPGVGFLSGGDFAARALRGVAIAIAFWLAAHAITLTIAWIGKRRGAALGRESVIGQSRGPLRALIVILGLYYAQAELGLTGRADRFLQSLLYLVAVGIAVYAGTRVAALSVSALGGHIGAVDRDRLDREVLPLVRKGSGLVVAAIGVVIALHHFGIEVTAIVTTLGIGGLAVGLAAKDTLSNMLAGFTILIDRPFRPGDRIKLASGEIGDVTEIGIRSTRIRLLDHNLLVVSNAELMNSRIVNYNYPSARGGGTVELRVDYGVDLVRIERVLGEIMRAQKSVCTEPAPQVLVRRLSEGALELSVGFTVESFAQVATVEDAVRREIHRRFAADGIALASPRLEVSLRNAPPAAR